MGNPGRQSKVFRLRFKNPRYNRIVRLNTETIARNMGFSEDQVFDITLAVEEAYTNAIEHGGKTARECLELEIIYRQLPDRLVISIKDSGCGFDGSVADLSGQASDVINDRGRGLGLILHLSDHAEIISEPGSGTTIRITKFLIPPVVPESEVRP